ncbi:MAG: TMEM43 family protein [Dokdonella sp.]
MMARARRKHGAAIALGLLLIAAAAGAAWWFGMHGSRDIASLPLMIARGPVVVSATAIDAANEGRLISVEGALNATKPARDTQLGIAADALVLMRDVQMLQWRERCAGAECDYTLDWSERPIDSQAFKHEKGHENPSRLPFASERFAADDLRLGVFKVDANMLAADASAPVAFAVHAAQLPPNLAATFRERDGVLYAGADPAHATVGDVRVSYRIVVPGKHRLSGVQHGDRLQATPPH